MQNLNRDCDGDLSPLTHIFAKEDAKQYRKNRKSLNSVKAAETLRMPLIEFMQFVDSGEDGIYDNRTFKKYERAFLNYDVPMG